MRSKNEQLGLLETLCNEPGITGFEAGVATIIRDELGDVTEEILRDRLGSIVCRKSGVGTSRVMLAAHMDEVGYMVNFIHEDGFIGYHSMGGWDPCQQLGMRVTIHTNKVTIPGVIAIKNRSSDDWAKPMNEKDLYIDTGALSKAEVLAAGVRIGDPISADYLFRRMGNPSVLMAKAFDCRAGVGVMIETILNMRNTEHPNTLYAVGTVQEEVGCRGAKTSAALVNPDFCIALDVAGAGDTLGDTKKGSARGLGKGPIIPVMDRRMITNPLIKDWVVNVADELGIPYQVMYMDGGSFDTSVVHLHSIGVPSVAIAVPTRYVHTTGSIIHAEDYYNTIRLVSEMVKRLDAKTIQGFWHQ